MRLRNDKGSSLVELMVVILVSMLAIISAMTIFVQCVKNFTTSANDASEMLIRKTLLQEITADVHSAEKIEITNNNKTLILQLSGDNSIEYKFEDSKLKKNNKNYCKAMAGSNFTYEESVVKMEINTRKGFVMPIVIYASNVNEG